METCVIWIYAEEIARAVTRPGGLVDEVESLASSCVGIETGDRERFLEYEKSMASCTHRDVAEWW